MTGAQDATRCAVASAHTLQAGPSLGRVSHRSRFMSCEHVHVRQHADTKQGKYTRLYGPIPAARRFQVLMLRKSQPSESCISCM